MSETTLGHGLDHDVDVAAVVEVAVADHDRIQLGQIDLALGVLHDGAGPGVEGDARLAILNVEATRRGELLGNHEPSTGGPHESHLHLGSPPRFLWGPRAVAREVVEAPEGPLPSATSLRAASFSPPKYRS